MPLWKELRGSRHQINSDDNIKVVSENKCVNCLVLLMDYKNNKFEQYNPMDEFTLD